MSVVPFLVTIVVVFIVAILRVKADGQGAVESRRNVVRHLPTRTLILLLGALQLCSRLDLV